MQVSHTSCIDHYDSIHAFIEKLELWFQRGNVASFFNLDAAIEKNKVGLDAELKAMMEARLQSLKQEFKRYFPNSANTDLS